MYIHHVTNKIDSQEQQSILHFNDGHEVSQADFVKSFQPTGEMDRSALRIQFSLWNAEWKAQKKPYFIVPEADPIVSTFFCNMHVHFFVFTLICIFIFDPFEETWALGETT